MSGALARLVARAAGREASGIRPRLRSRFEVAGPVAVPEDAAEVAAAKPVTPARPPVASPQVDGIRPVASLPAAPFERHAPGPAPPDPLQPRVAMPRHEPTAAVPKPALGAPQVAEDAVALPPEDGGNLPSPMERHHVVETQRTIDHRAGPMRADAPPAPLVAIPPQPTLPQRPVPAPAVPWRDRTVAAPLGREPAPEPPEVVISIGRIEVRAPPPERPKRPKRERPAMTRLGDYLGGGGRG